MPKQLDLTGILDIVRQRGASARSLTAIVGPPGAGKSTLADALVARLNDEAPDSAAVLPMDGYHFDDRILVPRGLRPRKGAPETFDVAGFYHMLQRLKLNEEPEIAVPVFDRDLEIACAGARLIPRSVRHLVVEGNYLLLDRPGWSRLPSLFDTTIMIAVPEAVLRRRLVERWQGYQLPPEEVAAKVEANDLPNGRLVISASVPAEFVFAF
ncbi:nucleoside triphosphate hydrolase [Dongia deserti]|uniref:nucleoside triphosphate hydrolase n=1 Tax=Dongia deserti TaxID=2268030 RepID=UPI000E6577F2|nr:nucleoside triphosphate hydrolase [Dongia deserti]